MGKIVKSLVLRALNKYIPSNFKGVSYLIWILHAILKTPEYYGRLRITFNDLN